MTHIYFEKRKGKRFSLLSICGNCLEKLGIHNEGGGYAKIDSCITPKVGDVVHCFKEGSNVGGYLKQVKRIEGDTYIVGTAYYDESKDFEFAAGEMVGVVVETYSKTWRWQEYARPSDSEEEAEKALADRRKEDEGK